MNPDLALNAGYNRSESHVEHGLVPAFTFEIARQGRGILRAERQADAARIGLSEAGWTLEPHSCGVRESRPRDPAPRRVTDRAKHPAARDRRDLRSATGGRGISAPELDVYRVDLITTDAAAIRAATGTSLRRAVLAMRSAFHWPHCRTCPWSRHHWNTAGRGRLCRSARCSASPASR